MEEVFRLWNTWHLDNRFRTHELRKGGNHRLSALVLSGKPFEVELWNVRGPFEKECLLDLEFWLKDKGHESADD